MLFIKDKLFIFCILLSLYLMTNPEPSVIPVLLALLFSGLNTYVMTRAKQSPFDMLPDYSGTYFNSTFLKSIGPSLDSLIPMLSLILFLLLSSISGAYLFFIPLLIYDMSMPKWNNILWLIYGAFILFFLCFDLYKLTYLLPYLFCALFCFLLKSKSLKISELSHTYYDSKYELEDLATLLTQKNKALLEKQDSEIHIATLNERNRIAREIHDNVGHLLSRCLLQIGALMTISKSQNELIYTNLSQIKETLSDAMNSIRSSVHDLHDEALDLHAEISKLASDFHFCAIHLEYDISSSPCKEIKYSFIAIVKEALSNIIKHAHPTQVEIILKEHPGFYQLIIRDNDLNNKSISSTGIGLNNMQDRIAGLNGQFSIDTTNGFRIFISVPKNKEITYESINR